jgi:tetratricopeptide (TPR) repeat protein
MPSLVRASRALLFAAAIVASPARGQSVEHAKRRFDDAKYTAARTELLAVQKADERNAAAAYYLGRIATIDNDNDEATSQFERAVEHDNTNALYHFWLGSALSDAAQRANILTQAIIGRRMKGEFERAVELDPNHIEARFRLLQLYAMAPAAMGGSMDEARKQAGEITKRNAMRGAIARATIALQEKNVAAEEAEYKQAIAAAPDSLAGYSGLAATYARNAKAADAFVVMDGYTKTHKNDHWALYYTGRVAGVTGQQLERGAGALKQFLASPPVDANRVNFASAQYWLGQIAEKRGAKDEAREHYVTALRLNPNSTASQRALDALSK